MNKRIIQATAEAIGTAEDTKKAIGMAVIMDQQKARGLEEYSKRMEADKQKNDDFQSIRQIDMQPPFNQRRKRK